jgi:lipoprotein-anchoring transpeptidase ErfK/SrfK
MTVRVGLLLRVALGAALAVFVGAGAGAQTPGQDEMNVVDQPGYQPTPDEEQLAGAYEKQEVFFRTTEAPGTVIIDTKGRFLYLVQGNNRALRYGIGVGREGFTWSGLQKIARKQEWPDWRPPPEMICRGSWPAVRAIRSARERCISAAPSIAFTAPTSRRRSDTQSRLAAFVW